MYNCDICDKEYKRENGYFGYNSTYGYCDNPACKREANAKVGEAMWEAAGNGDFNSFEDLVGDGDPFEFI